MNLVTIIIPMYNESNNIENCIKRLCEQTSQNFNVIFVDDGSKDNTINLLKKYLDINKVKFNFKLLTQENQGAAAARQLGIEKSNSEYLMFLDCDDYLSNSAIEISNKTLLNDKDFDILMPNFLIEVKRNKWKLFEFYSSEMNLSGIDCLKNSLGGWKVHGCNIYRKKIIVEAYAKYYSYNIEKNNYINNDEIITRIKFSLSRKINKINYKYNYCYNDLSTTKSFNSRMYLVVNNSFILNKIFKEEEYKTILCKEHVNTLWNLLKYFKKYRQNIEDSEKWLNYICKGMALISPNLLLKNNELKYYSKFLFLKLFLFFVRA